MPVDKSQARVKRMFSEIAPRYDLLNHELSLNIATARTLRLVVPHALLIRASQVVE